MASTETTTAEAANSRPGIRHDIAALVKVRLNFFVLITTFFGFILAARGSEIDWMLLVHTLLGTAAAAFGSSAFNQLMEIDLDARMKRTADRPLPSRRMGAVTAFGIGWVLSALGILHLAIQVNHAAAYLAAATIGIYVFVYTPMKRASSLNTLVGAVPGAIPPVIGWMGAGGKPGIEAAFLFALLFLWQLPHFVAINWLCREEYEAAGHKMWSNGDVSGKRSAKLCVIFSVVLAAVSILPVIAGFAHWSWGIIGPALALVMAALALKFAKDGLRTSFRKLFLYTLLYLPLALSALFLTWRPG
ncbi:MAG: heme o synthase [Verrucomicrobiota bacterium]